MGAAAAWKRFLELLKEADASVLVNDVTFWILSGLYGLIALAALVQLVRIHVRVPEYGMTTQKLFHILNCITATARCVVFALWFKIIAIGKDSGGSALVNVLLDFPSLLFFTTYTLLVLFWSEIYNQARSMSTSMLRPIFIIINAFVYIVTASVWTWMLIVENTAAHRGADAAAALGLGDDADSDINVHVLGFRITSIFFAVMSVLVVISFLFYGLKLFYMLRKFPLESKGAPRARGRPPPGARRGAPETRTAAALNVKRPRRVFLPRVRRPQEEALRGRRRYGDLLLRLHRPRHHGRGASTDPDAGFRRPVRKFSRGLTRPDARTPPAPVVPLRQVNAFVKEVELDVFGHPIYNFLYYSLTEIIPAILVLWVLRKMPARRAGANTNPTAVRRSFFGWISGRRAADDTAYEPIPVQP